MARYFSFPLSAPSVLLQAVRRHYLLDELCTRTKKDVTLEHVVEAVMNAIIMNDEKLEFPREEFKNLPANDDGHILGSRILLQQ